MKFSVIPKYCINLPKRTDRLESVIKEFSRAGIEVNIWKATDKESLIVPMNSCKSHEFNAKAIYACSLSHLSLIKFCKKNGHKYVAVFEDDIKICDDFHKRIKYVESLNLDFDMFYLGGHFHRETDITKTEHKYIYRCKSMAGTYSYILKDTVYDFIINNISYNYGMDEFYSEVVIKKFKAMAFIPFMVDHIDGLSDISGNVSTYPLTHKHYKQKITL